MINTVCHYTGLNIEPFKYTYPTDTASLVVDDIHNADFAENSFDLVFSIAVWEHIPNPLPIFNKVGNWLKESGTHYGTFQAWSGNKGHHIFSPRFPAHFVPDWGHITSTKDEFIKSLLANGCPEDKAEAIASFSYSESEINRVRLRDFVNEIKEGDLEVVVYGWEV